MRKVILLVAMLAPTSALAAELWCMPYKICYGTKCKKNSNEEVSVRIIDPDGPKPMMRAFAEDVPMTQTMEENKIVRWMGTNDSQATMILDLDTADMTYVMTSTLPAKQKAVYTGTCEVQ